MTEVLHNSIHSTSGDRKRLHSKSKKRKHKKNRRRHRKNKNKHRRKKIKNKSDNKLKPTTIRHIIEKVAEEALTRTSGSWDYSEVPRRGSTSVVTAGESSLDNTLNGGVVPTRTYRKSYVFFFLNFMYTNNFHHWKGLALMTSKTNTLAEVMAHVYFRLYIYLVNVYHTLLREKRRDLTRSYDNHI